MALRDARGAMDFVPHSRRLEKMDGSTLHSRFLDKLQIRRHHEAVQQNLEMLKERLRSVGMRITAPRLAVLAAVHPGGHLSADAIAIVARARLGSLSLQAVYDNLHVLLEAGLLRRIEPANGPALYEARVGDNHHHLVCARCGRVEDVDCAIGNRPCLEPSTTNGFLIMEAEVTFWGICAACQNQVPLDELETGNHAASDNLAKNTT